MENNNGSGSKKLESFFAGKGFYIVLFLCAAVIGVSAWTLLSGTGTVVDEPIGDIVIAASPTPTLAEPIPDDVLWDIPDDAVEVLAEPEPPIIATDKLSEPEPVVQSVPQTFIWPVIGTIEMPYSIDTLLYDTTMADWRTHDGLDIAAALGDKIMSCSSGSVTEVYNDALYGTTVVIDHGDGLTSVYSNLAELPTVKVGDVVMAGETIGAVGTTALCEAGEAYHLHFSMKVNGASADPYEYLPAL